jgi:hypothetical protein
MRTGIEQRSERRSARELRRERQQAQPQRRIKLRRLLGQHSNDHCSHIVVVIA